MTREKREKELELEEKELYYKLNKIKEEKEEIIQQKISEKRKEVAKKIRYLRENKDVILPLLEHSRTSCSDENPCNGCYDYNNGYARCNKCWLMEILDDEWYDENDGENIDFDIDFSVDFVRVENLI